MSKELSPKYNPAEVEAGRYQKWLDDCLLYTSPSPRDRSVTRMPSSA